MRGRVQLEKDFAQERADWYNVMPAYLLLTERELYVQFAESLAKVSSLPVQSNLQFPVIARCKGQLPRLFVQLPEGARSRTFCSKRWKTHMYACFRLLLYLQSDLDSFLLREIQDTFRPCTCAPHLLLSSCARSL